MSPSRFLSARLFAGRWLDQHGCHIGPIAIGPAMPAGPARAIYIACDWAGNVLYVGSTSAGVRRRIRQHCAVYARGRDWSDVWVIPLRDDTPLRQMRRIEGLVGLALRPLKTRSLPRAA